MALLPQLRREAAAERVTQESRETLCSLRDKCLGLGSDFTVLGLCTGTRLGILSPLLSHGVHLLQEKLYKMKILYCHGLGLPETHTNMMLSWGNFI